MRAWIGVFSLSAIGSGGFAVSELHQLEHHTPMIVQMPSSQPVIAVAAVVVQPPPPITPPPLSTWRGPPPFGGVPVGDDVESGDDKLDSDDEGEGIPDEEDRCPDVVDGEDNDGCPDTVSGTDTDQPWNRGPQRIVLRSEPEEVLIEDGDHPRYITLERSEIIIY
jgi:hypothetical protein